MYIILSEFIDKTWARLVIKKVSTYDVMYNITSTLYPGEPFFATHSLLAATVEKKKLYKFLRDFGYIDQDNKVLKK